MSYSTKNERVNLEVDCKPSSVLGTDTQLESEVKGLDWCITGNYDTQTHLTI